jgi:gluconate 2-dehydrogenase subunit 3-like protein
MADDKSKKAKSSINRRDALIAISSVPTVLVPVSRRAAAQEAKRQARPPVPQSGAGEYKRQTFDEHEWKTVRLLSDTIIPRDERSGSATDAAVPEFIDDWLALRGGEALAAVRGGLIWLDLECQRAYGRDFVDATPGQQKLLLDRIAYPKTAAPEDAAGVTFFNHLRDLVVSGFFSSKMGVQDLPYLGNQMLAEWPGCPAEVLEKLKSREA